MTRAVPVRAIFPTTVVGCTFLDGSDMKDTKMIV